MMTDIEERAILKIINPIIPRLSRASGIKEDDLRHQFFFCFNDVKINRPPSNDLVRMVYDALNSFLIWLNHETKISRENIEDALKEVRVALNMLAREDLEDGFVTGKEAKVIKFPTIPKK